jgi:HK97 family phage prohead protease
VVTAYAARFNERAEIEDWAGHYFEEFLPGSFANTIRGPKALKRIKVLYNHGKTPYGTPSERYSVPIGRPLELAEDPKGLLTRTLFYDSDEPSRMVLERMKDGTVTAYSVTFEALRSKTITGGGRNGLDLIQHQEARLLEYGPGLFGVYKGAEVVSIRTREDLETVISELEPEDRAELSKLLRSAGPTPDDAAPEGTSEEAGTGNDTSPTRSGAPRIVLEMEMEHLKSRIG